MRADGVLWTIRGAGFALGAGIVALVALVGFRAIGTAVLLFLGILLGAALSPIVTALRRHLPVSRGQAVGAVYLVFFLLLLALALVIVPIALVEGGRVGDRLPGTLRAVREWAAGVQPDFVGSMIVRLSDAAEGWLRGAARPPSAGDIVDLGRAAAETAMSLATLLVVVAFWLAERPRLQRYILSFAPASRRAGARTAWNRVERRLGRWVRGQLLLMAVIGIASGIAYQLLGLPGAVMLGLVAAICEAIPLVGPLLGAIPALLVAATVSPETALAVILVYVVIHLLEGNVLVPIVMRNAVGLSPLLILVSLMGGAAVGGIVGALVAVPLASAAEILLAPLQAREAPVGPEPRTSGSEGSDGPPPAEAPDERSAEASHEPDEPARPRLAALPDAPAPAGRTLRPVDPRTDSV